MATLLKRRLKRNKLLVGIVAASLLLVAGVVLALAQEPVLTDPELEQILQAARDAGASGARSTLLRLPLEVAPMFSDWLQVHVPDQARRVLARIRDTRGGKLYDADFAQRMSGSGHYAGLLAQRFELAMRRLGYRQSEALDRSRFQPPARDLRQMSLL